MNIPEEPDHLQSGFCLDLVLFAVTVHYDHPRH